jgi:hypothetical protein
MINEIKKNRKICPKYVEKISCTVLSKEKETPFTVELMMDLEIVVRRLA